MGADLSYSLKTKYCILLYLKSYHGSFFSSTQNFHAFEDYLINLHVNKDADYTKIPIITEADCGVI